MYRSFMNDWTEIHKKIVLHLVDLKLGNVIVYKITQSLIEFYYVSFSL